MRGRTSVAALAVLLGLASAILTASPADARADPCAAVRLTPGAMMTGAQLADCLTTRMSAAGPARTRITVDGHVTRSSRATASMGRLATAIRSVPRWGVLQAEPGVDGDGDRLHVWRFLPSFTSAQGPVAAGGTVLELSDDILPVLLTSTLAIGHQRFPYSQAWAGWRSPEALGCGSCQGLAPPAHRG